jgi:hypothetical protein
VRVRVRECVYLPPSSPPRSMSPPHTHAPCPTAGLHAVPPGASCDSDVHPRCGAASVYRVARRQSGRCGRAAAHCGVHRVHPEPHGVVLLCSHLRQRHLTNMCVSGLGQECGTRPLPALQSLRSPAVGQHAFFAPHAFACPVRASVECPATAPEYPLLHVELSRPHRRVGSNVCNGLQPAPHRGPKDAVVRDAAGAACCRHPHYLHRHRQVHAPVPAAAAPNHRRHARQLV